MYLDNSGSDSGTAVTDNIYIGSSQGKQEEGLCLLGHMVCQNMPNSKVFCGAYRTV